MKNLSRFAFSLLFGASSFALESVSTRIQCQSGNFLQEPSIRVEVLLEQEHLSNQLSQGLVLVEHWSLNPKGNHAFAPDMIFLKDFYRATVRNGEAGFSLTDPSGASLTVSPDLKSAVFEFRGNRNVVRTFTVEQPLSMFCQPVTGRSGQKRIYTELYQ